MSQPGKGHRRPPPWVMTAPNRNQTINCRAGYVGAMYTVPPIGLPPRSAVRPSLDECSLLSLGVDMTESKKLF